MDTIMKILFAILIIAIMLSPLYYSQFAPRYRIRVKMLDKGQTIGLRSGSGRYSSGAAYSYYWGEFLVVETNEIIKLGMDVNLYVDIKEGQRGILTYRKGYALAFQRIGKLKRRQPSAGEKLLDFFWSKL